MRPDPIFEFCLGLAAILVALGLALLFAFPPAWLDSRHTAVALFGNVGTLGEGADVRENGYVVGNVVAIDSVPGGYLVKMKVRPKWRIAAGAGLTVEETNPLRAAGLSVAHVCKAAGNFDAPATATCCPDSRLITPTPGPGETALPSCGRIPSMIDVALATTYKVMFVTTELRVALGLEQANKAIAALPGKSADKSGMVANANALMLSLKDLSGKAGGMVDKAGGLVDEKNKQNLSATLANAKTSTDSLKEVLGDSKDQLKASISDLTTVLHDTATRLPVIVDDMQKASENMKAISSQIRSEPTSLIRGRERSDPGFVEPADKK